MERDNAAEDHDRKINSLQADLDHYRETLDQKEENVRFAKKIAHKKIARLPISPLD